MAIVTAWWGVWHIVAGMTLATFWKSRPPKDDASATKEQA
jgi:BASS family bile acid:Na+ symporter